MTRAMRLCLISGLVLELASVAPVRAADYFRHGYYTPTEGTVGQYLTSDAAFGVEDMPAPCLPVWNDIAITGTLPPGMDISNSSSTVIAGTPTVAGDFAVVVTFHGLGCSVGGDHEDRAITVNFHIKP